jgi:formylglycine-generating enzyme
MFQLTLKTGDSQPQRVQRSRSFLCTDEYCTRYLMGTRGKGDVDTGSNHLGFRCVKDAEVGTVAKEKTQL